MGNSFNYEAARAYYFAVIYSVISYGLVVYGGCILESGKLVKLQKYQNKIMLNLFQQFFTCNNINELYKKSSILKVADIYRLKVVAVVHKMQFENYHPKLFDFVCEQQLLHNRPFRNYDHYIRPIYPRVNAVRNSFQYRFATVWNGLPDNIRSMPNSRRFKIECMNYLLSLYN